MRGVIGGMNSANNAVETVNAAANAIGLAEARPPRPTSEKWRWSSCWSWSIYACFGSQKHNKRIRHAVLVPDTTFSQTETPLARSLGRPPPISVPFAAPPSSPASFLPSEPPSSAHSPAGSASFASISANMYSPGGPRSIFAVGPYAYETQLVSPPVFSTFTTEPSTAPFTPPPESIHFTTPSSPEVPFAKLLDPSIRSDGFGQRFAPSQYEFQTYHFYPGSPLGQLISPASAISGSGASSPFLDGLNYRDIRVAVPSKLLKLQSLPARGWGSCQRSGTLTPDAIQPKSRDTFLDHEGVIDQRFSFELTNEVIVRCAEKGLKSDSSDSICQTSSEDATKKIPSAADAKERHHGCQRQRSVSLGSAKEFDFDNDDNDDSHKPCMDSNLWVDEKILVKEGECPSKNWSFPIIQTGVN